MGKLKVSGIDNFLDDLSNLCKLPDAVVESMLNAEADVVVAAQRKMAKSMGVLATGVTASSIRKGKVEKRQGKLAITVSPRGKNRRGNRNAEVAFINEYGKHGQPARPFIRTANQQAERKIVEAGEKVYNTYLDGKKL